VTVADTLGILLAEAAPSNPAQGTDVRLILGTVVAVDWVAQSCTVNTPDGSSVYARMAGDPPVPGLPIYVLVVGQNPVTLGRPPRPPLGTVAGAPDAGLVDVLADDGVTYTVGLQPSYTPAAGHRVLLDWDAGGHIINRVDAAPTPKPPAQNTGGGTVRKSQQFKATDSGSFRSSWSSGVVYFGQSYPSAGWFYGTQIANTIPDDATIENVSIYLEVTAQSGVAALPLYLHTSASRPGGGLALDQQFNAGSAPNGFRGSVRLPNSWGDLLKTGARLGVGTTGPGYRRLNGPAQSAVAGAISITWTE
jgi:hypothetical protein